MIGNDIVDLKHASVQKGAQHPRFEARVFAVSERAEIARRAGDAALRWRYWAAKEAAYKAAKKLAPETVWSPADFVVETLEGPAGFCDARGLGAVRHGAQKFVVHFLEATSASPRAEFSRAECVHAVAQSAADTAIAEHGIAHLEGDDDPSRAVRAHALRALEALAPRQNARIESEHRIPFVTVAGARAPLDISLSHHGRFVAWALERAEHVARDA